jgi:predicted dehydrogenase
MSKLRFALFGTGFWSSFQLAGWLQTEEVQCVALYNRTKSKATALARQFGIPEEHVYDDPVVLLEKEQLDFVDICTSVETHYSLAGLVVDRGLPVVCQKPMATTLTECQMMVKHCRDAGVALYINENWRWQYPIRQLKRAIDSRRIGRVFRATIDYRNSFPVFDNQPFLKDLEQFIITDIGSHILDTARFLFGEPVSLYCQTARVHPDIKGEDVATVILTLDDGALVTCLMSYASMREYDRFPETFVQVEGDQGFLELAPDFWIRETTVAGTNSTRHKPPHFSWADTAYDVIHSSIYTTQLNLARAIKGLEPAETTGEDNLRTMSLVFSAYQSAQEGNVIRVT